MVSIIEGDWIQRFQSCSYLPVMHCDAVFSFIVRGKILIEREEGTVTNSGTSSASSFSFSFEVNCFLFTALMAQPDTDGASLHEDWLEQLWSYWLWWFHKLHTSATGLSSVEVTLCIYEVLLCVFGLWRVSFCFVIMKVIIIKKCCIVVVVVVVINHS